MCTPSATAGGCEAVVVAHALTQRRRIPERYCGSRARGGTERRKVRQYLKSRTRKDAYVRRLAVQL